jgi:hypothetical protein
MEPRLPRPISPANPLLGRNTGKPVAMQPVRPGVLGIMHKGGTIKKTGNYRLKKGEAVVPLSALLRAK